MKLIGSLTSPFVRKVRIFLLEKKIPFQFEIDIPWNESTQVPKYNPLGKVPVLMVDENTPLVDSRAIVEFLEFYQPEPTLIPKDKFFQIKQIEVIADGMADALANCFIEKNMRTTQQQSEAWMARQLGKVDQCLNYLSLTLGTANHFCTDQFNLADIAVLCALAYMKFRFSQINWESTYPNLANFYQNMHQMDLVQSTTPKAS